MPGVLPRLRDHPGKAPALRLATLTWSRADGWSGEIPDLDSPRTLVIAFGDRALDGNPTALTELSGHFPMGNVVGCSTSGAFSGPALDTAELTVAVVRFDRTSVTVAEAPVHDATTSFAAGRALAAELHRPELRAVFILSDGLHVNGSDLVRGVRSVLPDDVVVTGGLAGDADRFESTWTYARGGLADNRVIAVGLFGTALDVGYGSAGGWGIFGPERIITRSEGNVLHELDGRPALELYKRYLGDLAAGLPASALLFPLSVRADDGDEPVVRTVLAVDEEHRTMTFAGDVPQGWRAQLMRASVDRLVDGAASAGAMCRVGSDGEHAGRAAGDAVPGETLGIAVSCVGRRLVLGERTDEEIEATLDALGSATTLVGFYSYGEIAPSASGFCDLHNQTMTVTTFREG